MKSRIIFVGAGDFGYELINWFFHSNPNILNDHTVGFIDDNVKVLCVGGIDLCCYGDINTFVPLLTDKLYLAISKPSVRRYIVHQLKNRGAFFSSFIHPSALISKTALVGEGCIFCPFSLASVGSVLDEFVIVNCYTSIGHDVHVGAFSTLSSHVDLTGHAIIGADVVIGSGARVLPRLTIGDCAVVGAGAVVMRSVPNNRTVYAAPAKLL